MGHEINSLTEELDHYREGLVSAFDYLHQNPYHTYIKMPYVQEVKELLEGFSINTDLAHRLEFDRTYDQGSAFNQLRGIFTNSALNISSENANNLAGYVADILNESYKSDFYNHDVFSLMYSLWFETNKSSQSFWHKDGGEYDEICSDNHLSFLYTMLGPSTLFYDDNHMINGFDFGRSKSSDPSVAYQFHIENHGKGSHYLQGLDYCPTDIQYISSGYANIHSRDNSIHSPPEIQDFRIVLGMGVIPKAGNLYQSWDVCNKMHPKEGVFIVNCPTHSNYKPKCSKYEIVRYDQETNKPIFTEMTTECPV